MHRFLGDKVQPAAGTIPKGIVPSNGLILGKVWGSSAKILSPLEPCRALWEFPKQEQPSCITYLCPQTWQAKGFSLVWVSMCLRRSFLFLEAKLQWGHLCGRRLAC